jgi:hypothetical protein
MVRGMVMAGKNHHCGKRVIVALPSASVPKSQMMLKTAYAKISNADRSILQIFVERVEGEESDDKTHRNKCPWKKEHRHCSHSADLFAYILLLNCRKESYVIIDELSLCVSADILVVRFAILKLVRLSAWDANWKYKLMRIFALSF